MLVAKNIKFSYNKDTEVLNDFNLEIEGSIFGLIGKNGAGKSTFLKLALGLLTPHQGTVIIDGNDINRDRIKILQKIGVLHENPAFPPWVQCLPYLKLVGKLRGFSEEHATGQAKYLLNTFDLDDKYYAYVNKLSAGQRQKFGLCQAVIGLPPLIFLDEPTANLDAHARIQVLDFLSTITREFDLTIVIMSHILSDLERYCDNIAIIHNGEIRYKNSVAKILEDVDITQFTLRSEKLTDDKIRSLLTNESSLEITNKGNDLVVSVHNNDQRRELDELIDNHRISKFPYRTKLETLFLEYTDMELV